MNTRQNFFNCFFINNHLKFLQRNFRSNISSLKIAQ